MTSEHYFSPSPDGAADRHPLRLTLAGHEVELVSAAGVFSGDRLDLGTRVLLRDVLLAVSSFLIDISLFSLFLALSDSILLSTYCARLLSGTYNFLGNRHFVFRTGGNRRLSREAAQYVALACLVATLSGIMVGQVQQFKQWSAVVSKMTVDLSMYCVSFILRRSVIFRPRRKQDGMADE